ncbi:MAG: Crp/Fnr family transcriptional regulator [Bacteroidota bacterium]
MELIQHLHENYSLTEEEVALVESSFQPLTLKKGAYFLQEGQICRKIGYIEKGAVLYFTTADGEEQVCDFAFETGWITHVKSLSSQQPSEMNIRALEACSLKVLEGEKMLQLAEDFPKVNLIRLKIADRYYVESAERSETLATLDAEQRYVRLLKTHPEIIHRVPQYYVASYLGIKPQSLSRIRAKKPGPD